MNVRRVAALSTVDQAVSSLSNLVAVIVAARHLTAEEFGLFSVALVLWSVLVPGVQAFSGQELQLRDGDQHDRLRQSAAALVAAAGAGMLLAAGLLVGGLVVEGLRGPLVMLACVLPLLAVQEVMRSAAGYIGSIGYALLSDCLWLLGVTAWAVVVEWRDSDLTATGAVAVWGLTGAVAAIAVVGPFVKEGFAPLARYRRGGFLGYRFFAEFAVTRATGQVLVLALGALAGVAATGAYRGATSLVGPLTVAVLAIATFGAPLARMVDRTRWRSLALGGTAVITTAVAVYAGLLLLLPERAGTALLGESWGGARDLLLPVAIMMGATATSALMAVLLRLVDPRATLGIRILTALLMVPLFSCGYALWGVTGGAWGITAATVIQSVSLAMVFSRRLSAHA